MSNADVEYMERALALAEEGRFSVSPNPMVGCVLVSNGTIIGEGFHRAAGLAHAEVEALKATTVPSEGATAYVTLEPCAHTGRTPPCVDALIEANVRRVVIAIRDPHSVAAGGMEHLKAAGIEVVTGVCEDAARRQNEKFFHAVIAGSPFVLIKAGMTLDGKLATITRQSRWITSEASRERSFLLREEYDAILIGSGTVAADDPRLARRGESNSRPWTRVVIDGDGSTPPAARLLTDGSPTILFTTEPARYAGSDSTIVVGMRADNGRLDLETILRDLHERGIRSLIVEGGSEVHSDFIRRKLWQKMVLFVAPMIIGGSGAPAIFGGEGVSNLADAYRLRFDEVESIGSDLMIIAYPERPQWP